MKDEGIKAVGCWEKLNARKVSIIEALCDPILRDLEGKALEYPTLVPPPVFSLRRNERNVSYNVAAVVLRCTIGANNGAAGAAADGHIQLVILPKRSPLLPRPSTKSNWSRIRDFPTDVACSTAHARCSSRCNQDVGESS